MSRRFDEYWDSLPRDIEPYESYFTKDGVDYRALDDECNYYISSDGEVISYKNGIRKVMETWPNQYGHRYTRLYIGNRKKTISIHREVAKAFVPNPHGYNVVRHNDDDPENNHYRNLSWGTQFDNIMDCRNKGRDFHKAVYCVEKDRLYRTGKEAAEDFGVSNSLISSACTGRVKSVKGFHFCFEEDMEEKLKDDNWLRSGKGFKPIVAVSPEGKRYFFRSRKEASKFAGIPPCGISGVVNGHLKHTHGWRFEEE